MQYFNREKVESALNIPLGLKLSKTAFELHSSGHVEQPLRNIIPSEDGKILGTMPAYIRKGRYAGFGVKSVLVDFERVGKEQSHEGSILLYSALPDGQSAIVDAASITELRTAAASALATDILAKQDAKRLAVLGTGVQAKAHLLSILSIRPVEEVFLWGRNQENTLALEAWLKTIKPEIDIRVFSKVQEAVIGADIICTVTASKEPFLGAQVLPQNCHINAVGASAPAFQELMPDVYSSVELFVDSLESVWSASRCLTLAEQQGLIKHNSGIEIGQLTNGCYTNTSKGRTLFKSVGLAVQDLVFAREVVNQYYSVKNN
ncbi:ornithine cyclodeaminase family protein [Thalassotalea euphylliae]|uniref:Ornithine cyclodeaminase family protein n=2 Tax=Thalassotalea euphylliae TaxID=1655234 RepID=A0A3E0U7K6_9GAMM|nr:ornithine cyclodeaminase family protein [Thalassotalea euphylliae]